MRIEAERKLFVGLKVDNKLRDQLTNAPPKDRSFFDGSDERYLILLRTDADEAATYLGKVIDAGASATGMEDFKRNLLSILNRIAPGRHRDDAVKVFSIGDGEGPTGVAALARPPKPEDVEGEYERCY
jgi:hypothetical protein